LVNTACKQRAGVSVDVRGLSGKALEVCVPSRQDD
jgi:hypothetical protein